MFMWRKKLCFIRVLKLTGWSDHFIWALRYSHLRAYGEDPPDGRSSDGVKDRYRRTQRMFRTQGGQSVANGKPTQSASKVSHLLRPQIT